jgi:hypothetical protein
MACLKNLHFLVASIRSHAFTENKILSYPPAGTGLETMFEMNLPFSIFAGKKLEIS